MRIAAIFCVFASIFCGSAAAEDATIAVAANFALPMERLEADFETRTGHDLTVVTGSTGQLFAQIVHGAPFDVFLSADVDRIDALEARGGIVEGERFTYAIGELVLLWAYVSVEPGAPEASAASPELRPAPAVEILSEPGGRLAIANPDLAPYGRASLQVLENLGVADDWRRDLVLGQDVGQASAFIRTGAVELALTSRSLEREASRNRSILSWDIPAELHDPIRQDAALLPRAADNPVAIAFFEYLQSEDARALIAASGYRLD